METSPRGCLGCLTAQKLCSRTERKLTAQVKASSEQVQHQSLHLLFSAVVGPAHLSVMKVIKDLLSSLVYYLWCGKGQPWSVRINSYGSRTSGLLGCQWESISPTRRKERTLGSSISWWFAGDEKETKAIVIIITAVVHIPGLIPQFGQPGKQSLHICSWKLQNLRLTHDKLFNSEIISETIYYVQGSIIGLTFMIKFYKTWLLCSRSFSADWASMSQARAEHRARCYQLPLPSRSSSLAGERDMNLTIMV